MTTNLQAHIDKLIKRVDGLEAVLITDRDGVIILQASGENASSKLLEPILSNTFVVASDQASKLGLKKNHNSAVQLFPLVLSLVADAEANTGVLMDLGNELKPLTDVIIAAISEQKPKDDEQ
ncbi:ragulator complex protein LAMTOR3-like protein [Basidiobolus meristosporus CBS 931.73]|uniref:Ragulator complex protein LAMTOR3-like protein n=1 Tax=Basidiobolus meristosporus CBS 931.73 TaxID=1314790 RepID=A0A1Y1XTU3_9FUNG|nr:ragulator complex protein LAMTOR3-like protein [Basidiobolus meristosporus CBS 931.73]|eukprot:ORX89187.1 ragulator complex protein LAMTOR3-like protein [Basidiobolus meristosporus CBS 931.73]